MQNGVQGNTDQRQIRRYTTLAFVKASMELTVYRYETNHSALFDIHTLDT
jgi:hypothetical protein